MTKLTENEGPLQEGECVPVIDLETAGSGWRLRRSGQWKCQIWICDVRNQNNNVAVHFLRHSAARHSTAVVSQTSLYFSKALLMPFFRWIHWGNRKQMWFNFGFLCWLNLKKFCKVLLNHPSSINHVVSWWLRSGSQISSNAGVSWPERWTIAMTAELRRSLFL